MTSLSTLERAAIDVVSILKGIDEFSNARIAVIGTNVEQKLLALANSPIFNRYKSSFTTSPEDLVFKLISPQGDRFVDISKHTRYGNKTFILTWATLGPYLPAAARTIKDTPANFIPYISPIDLVVFKMHCCRLRAKAAKRRTDAGDAEAVLESETRDSALDLTSAQKAIVKPCIADMIKYGTRSVEWWKQRLGMPASK
ncbi:MAG: hypothetical protein Q9208_004373 [Pyrenodesmia sp. 3 TL-2023]